MIENVLDQETRHEIRYHVQYVFLPKLVESVSEGYLPSIALFTFAPWYYNLRQYYDIKELKDVGVYERFERIDVDENHMLILYVFPQPQEMTEAVYGAVMLNTVTCEAEYYTLESSFDDRWVLGHKTTSSHSNFGSLDSADKDKFVAWVIERTGKKK
jgi:hypothetical protein